MALDQMLVFENAERLTDGGASNSAFGGKIIHGRNLLARRPKPGLDAPPEQARELNVAGNAGAMKSTLLPISARGGIAGSSFQERARTTRKQRPRHDGQEAMAKRRWPRHDQDLRDSLLAFLAIGQESKAQGATGSLASGHQNNTKARPGQSRKTYGRRRDPDLSHRDQ
jgi:hypothetical protein